MKAKTCFYIFLLACLGGAPHTIAQPTNAVSWGEAVEGVQARLRAKQTNWNAGVIPRLFVDVRNQGSRRLMIEKRVNGCELEWDGRWFRRPSNTLETRPLPSPFPPGRQYDDIVVNLDRLWEIMDSQDVRRSRRTVPERLSLTPGKHTVRVAVNATADKTDPGKPVRALSTPIVLEILSGQATASNAPDRLHALVEEIGAAKLVQAARQTQSRHGQATRQPGSAIAPELWADVLRQLQPECVYLHGVNVVAVLKSVPGKEQGLYICLPESSMMPSNGTDGFTFVRLAAQVYQFERLP